MGLLDRVRGDELPLDDHYDVGTFIQLGEHEPVTQFTHEETSSFLVCLDCGYLTDDATGMKDVECDEGRNGAIETWRERIDGNNF